MATRVRDTAWLEWMADLMGMASRRTYTATLPPDRFHCLLDELPLHLIPRDFLRSGRVRKLLEQPLFLNPRCSIHLPGQWPDELAGREDLFAGFALQGSIAWVREPATSSLLPFWLGPRLEATVRSLRSGDPVPAALAGNERFALAVAGILIAEDQIEEDQIAHHQIAQDQVRQSQSECGEVVARGGAAFREKGYVPLRSLIHPFHVASLRRYYRSQLRRGAFRLGDANNPLRYVAHDESVARFFHHQLTSTVSVVAGQPVKPSYVYFASYLSGAELTKHTDRPQCEFSVTLCLDFSPEPACETSWPIRLDTPQGTVAVYQALGDGLVYRGTRVPHYRSALPAGRSSTSIFFHYVAADFEGSLE